MDNFYIKLIIVFCAINGLGIAYSHVLEKLGIINVVGMLGNILLAVATALSYYYHRKAITAESNHAFIRLVYVSTLLKLVLCLVGVGLYVYIYQERVSAGTILLFFALYIVYTVLETTSLLKKKPKPDKS
jgi:Kef-type K+ transport system membrane component KefB